MVSEGTGNSPYYPTRITTLLKKTLKKWNGQTNTDKYRVAAHKILHDIISEQKLDLLSHEKAEEEKILHMDIPMFLVLNKERLWSFQSSKEL